MSTIIGNPQITEEIERRQDLLDLAGHSVRLLMEDLSWGMMDDGQRRMCIIYLVSQVETEEELQSRLGNDLSLTDACISWHQPDLSNQSEVEAQMLVRALGGLVSKSGALVMIMTADNLF